MGAAVAPVAAAALWGSGVADQSGAGLATLAAPVSQVIRALPYVTAVSEPEVVAQHEVDRHGKELVLLREVST
jgi:hypothetical protein